MSNINYRTFETARDLGAIAQDLADANGAPVAILSRYADNRRRVPCGPCLYRVCELAELYELLVEQEHWQTEAIVDPMTWAEPQEA